MCQNNGEERRARRERYPWRYSKSTTLTRALGRALKRALERALLQRKTRMPDDGVCVIRRRERSGRTRLARTRLARTFEQNKVPVRGWTENLLSESTRYDLGWSFVLLKQAHCPLYRERHAWENNKLMKPMDFKVWIPHYGTYEKLMKSGRSSQNKRNSREHD